MELLHTILMTVHIIAGISVIGLVLLQHGKGADMGAGFLQPTIGSAPSARNVTRVEVNLESLCMFPIHGFERVGGARRSTAGDEMHRSRPKINRVTKYFPEASTPHRVTQR